MPPFPVYVRSCSGANGTFSGEGYTIMPEVFLKAKLRVRWSNVFINTDRRMVTGWVDGIYDEANSQIANLDDIFEGGAIGGTVKQGITKADVDLNFTIPDNANFVFTPSDSTITVSGENGAVAGTFSVAEQLREGNSGKSIFPITVADKDGNIYRVEEKPGTAGEGKTPELVATKMGTQGKPIPDGAVKYKELDSDKATVTFEKGAGKYAFDTWRKEYLTADLIHSKYEQLGEGYVPFKLLPQGKTDVVLARISIKDKDIDPNKVLFKTPQGTEFTYKYENGEYTINLTGGEAGDGQEVYALYPNGSKYYNLGKLVVLSYTERTYKVVIVPVNGNTVDMDALKQTLGEVYSPVGVSWELSEDRGFSYDAESIVTDGSGFLRSYTPEMLALNKAYKQYLIDTGKELSGDAVYLFALKSGSMKGKGMAGDMPRGAQFGYLFTEGVSTGEVAHTVAHELGHGRLKLEHTFDSDYKIKQGDTDNLMDYAGGTHLAKWQWDLINDPAIVVAGFDGDEDAMFAGRYVLNPNYEFIRVPNSSTIYAHEVHVASFKTGTLPGFVVYDDFGNKKLYSWTNDKYTNIKDDSDIYEVTKTMPSRGSRIMLFYNTDYECGKKSYIDTVYNDAVITALKGGEPNAVIMFIKNNYDKSVQIPCAEKNPQKGWTENPPITLNCDAPDIQAALEERLDLLKKLPESATPKEVNGTLFKDGIYLACLFESIDIETKIKLLNILLKDDVDDAYWEFSQGPLSLGDRFFLDNLVLSTKPADRVELLKSFMANNYKWLRRLWDEAGYWGNDVGLSELTGLLSGVGGWVMDSYKTSNNELGVTFTTEKLTISDGLEVDIFAGANPILLGRDDDNYIWKKELGSGAYSEETLILSEVKFLDNGSINFVQLSKILTNTNSWDGKANIIYTTEYPQYNRSFSPFEPVVLRIGNTYEFLGFPDDAKGQEIVVPSILAAMYIQKVINNKTEYNVRMVGNVVAITVGVLAAPATGGTSLAAVTATIAVAAGSVAAVDIPIQRYKLSLQESNDYANYSNLFDAWDYVYYTAAVVDMGAGATSLAVNAPKIAQFAKSVDWVKRAKHFGGAIKQGTSETAAFFRGVLQNPKMYVFNLRLNQQISKGLISETEFAKANRLFSTPLKQHEIVEYVLPKSAVQAGESGEYYIKAALKENGSEVVIGQFVSKNSGDVEFISYAESYAGMSKAVSITNDVLKYTVTNLNGFARYPNISKRLDEVNTILNSAGFDRYRFEKLLRESDNLNYLEENATLLPEIAGEIKPKMQYSDADILTIFKKSVNTDYVKSLLPDEFVSSLKTFGITEDEIVTYFRNYHNVHTKGEFFTQIEEVLLKNNPYNLTRDEAYALWGYTTNYFYRDLNELLNDASKLSQTKEISVLLNSALKKLPDFDGAIVYRGIEIKPTELDAFLQDYAQGKIQTWKGFASCGSNSNASFITRENVNVVFEIKHLNGKDISNLADGIKYRGMQPSEILIRNGGKYISEIKPFYDSKLGKYKIVVTQIE